MELSCEQHSGWELVSRLDMRRSRVRTGKVLGRAVVVLHRRTTSRLLPPEDSE